MSDLILNQTRIPKNQWRYGLRCSAAVGCGWIATYNALRLMRYRAEPEQLIRYYERQLPLIHGNAGTTLFAPAVCFRQWGFPVELVFDRKRFDEKANEADVCILFYRWRNGIRFGAHFVACHRTDTGFVGYNTYKNSDGPDVYGYSLSKFLEKRKYFGAVLIAVKDKRA